MTWATWCTTDSTTSGTDTWNLWCDSIDSGTCSATTATSNIWYGWNGDYYQQYIPEPTEEELQAREQARLEAEERIRQQQAEREAATQRSLKLLEEILEQEQKEQLKQDDSIIVKTKKRQYLIKRGWAGNIYELDDCGKPIARLCVHPRVQVPEYDNMVAQKLMLETNEDLLRQTANITMLQ